MTNNTIEAKYITQELEQIIHLDMVIVELKTTNIGVNLLQRFWGTSRYYDLMTYYYSIQNEIKRKIYDIEKIDKAKVRKMLKQKLLNKKLKKKFVSNINNVRIEQIIQRINPDWIIVFGTSIIKENILKLAPKKFLNIHLSLLPAYRGAMSEFWQSYYDDYETVGITIHEITPEIDEGRIYAQYHTRCNEKDSYILIRYFNIVNVGVLLREQLEQILEGKVTVKNHYKRIKMVYKSKMITDEIKLEYYKKKGRI